MSLRLSLMFGAMLVTASAQASKVAVVDSGVDVEHRDFSSSVWVNPADTQDGKDNDGNGFVDDLVGWNFISNTNSVLDSALTNDFSEDIYEFYKLMGLLDIGKNLSPEQGRWLQSKASNPGFLEDVRRYGGFAHGTHVAGISIEKLPTARFLSLKMIPTNKRNSGIAPASLVEQNSTESSGRTATPDEDREIKEFIAQEAERNKAEYARWGAYLKSSSADVANCSFGTSTQMMEENFKEILKSFYGETPSTEDVKKYAKAYVTQVLKAAEHFSRTSPETLFVIAAGNDARNNDTNPVSPANLRESNTLTVAATVGVSSTLADFSNFGAESVDVAAPGVAIRSQAPGNRYTWMSGTSQAAPFVTNIASRAKDVNPSLNTAQLKKLILGTVDVKPQLRGKVASSGIVNPQRAYSAATFSKTMTLDAALAKARTEIPDQKTFVTPLEESAAREDFKHIFKPVPLPPSTLPVEFSEFSLRN